VGRSDERKNLPALLRAYKEIEREDTFLVLHTNKRYEDLMSIRRLGIENYVYTSDIGYKIWSISHEELPRIYGLALNERRGILVLPSKGEGFGLPLVEASAMTIPPIATKWGGMADGQVVDGETGYLINVRKMEPVTALITSTGRWAMIDEEELTDRMALLYANPDLCDEMGLKAREHMLKNWTWERAARMAHDAMRRVVR